MEKDFWGTMDGLSKSGFRNVELAGFYGQTAIQVKEGLAKRRLHAGSMHVGIDEVRKNFDGVVGDAHTLGLEHVVIPWLDPKSFPGGWLEVAEVLSSLAEKLEKHDLHLSYHNHAFEFEKQEGGVSGYEILWANASSKLLAEVDVYWVKKGGQDPAFWIKKLAQRVRLAHYKDIDDQGEFAQVGQGKLDWAAINKECNAAKTLYAIIENDQPKIDPLQAVIQSRDFLIKQGLKD